jgi:hypothetical protein
LESLAAFKFQKFWLDFFNNSINLEHLWPGYMSSYLGFPSYEAVLHWIAFFATVWTLKGFCMCWKWLET